MVRKVFKESKKKFAPSMGAGAKQIPARVAQKRIVRSQESRK